MPGDAPLGVRQALKELDERLTGLGAGVDRNNLRLRGGRVGGASDAVRDDEYVTLAQLKRAVRIAREESIAAALSGTTPTPGGPGPDDGGAGAAGCAAAGSDGHATGTLTAELAGQIVCGTGNEFPALKLAAVDQTTRDANQLELLLRMIWHLNQAGFTAGRQQNPSGIVSGDKLTVQVGAVFFAYDVFEGVPFNVDMPTQMLQVFPANYVAEAGTAD